MEKILFNILEVDLNNQSKGVYFVELILNDKRIVRKIILQ